MSDTPEKDHLPYYELVAAHRAELKAKEAARPAEQMERAPSEGEG
jgi:hypothetical protein